MSPVKLSDGLLVVDVPPPGGVTDTLTPPDRSADEAVNSIASSVPPPVTGSAVLATKLKSASVADPAVSTDVPAEATRPDGASAFLAFFVFVGLLSPGLPPEPLPFPPPLGVADGEGDGCP